MRKIFAVILISYFSTIPMALGQAGTCLPVLKDFVDTGKELKSTFEDTNTVAEDIVKRIDKFTEKTVPDIIAEVKSIRLLVEDRISYQFIAGSIAIASILSASLISGCVLGVLKVRHEMHNCWHRNDPTTTAPIQVSSQ